MTGFEGAVYLDFSKHQHYSFWPSKCLGTFWHLGLKRDCFLSSLLFLPADA